VTVPEAVFLEGEKAIVERDHLRTTDKLKDERIAAQQEQLKAKDDLLKVKDEQLALERSRGDNWAKAALERKEAIVFDDKAFQIQGADLLRVRAERDSARAANKWWGVGGLVIGAALVFAQQRRN